MPTKNQIELEKVELEKSKQKYQLASVALGTFLVSVFGAWLTFSENTRKNSQDFDTQHRDYVSKFLDVAISDDIHVRIRFARYLSSVTLDDKQRELWKNYSVYLEGLRDRSGTINEEIKSATQNSDAEEVERLKREKESLERQLEQLSDPSSSQTKTSKQCVQEYESLPARWLCIAAAELGQQELPGMGSSNERILGYARFLGLEYQDDDIPWSGLFVAWVVAQSSSAIPLPDNVLVNRNWLDFGIEATDPGPGDILVFWRGSRDGRKGHVGFYHSEDEKHYYVLGGNQANAVNVRGLPKDRLLGARTSR